jgi:hypothetical protein
MRDSSSVALGLYSKRARSKYWTVRPFFGELFTDRVAEDGESTIFLPKTP